MSSLNAFQWIALSFLLVLLIVELYNAARGHVLRRVWGLRVLTWIATGLAIYRPDQVTMLARSLGIQRGADLVLYLAVLMFFAASLYLYARCLRLQQQITLIVRHIAVAEARLPTEDDTANL